MQGKRSGTRCLSGKARSHELAMGIDNTKAANQTIPAIGVTAAQHWFERRIQSSQVDSRMFQAMTVLFFEIKLTMDWWVSFPEKS